MIKKIHLKNFKSFKDIPDINLAKINVLAGANSSGKSSILQGILLLKQTVQYGSENRSLTLNGPLLRLGAFEDIRNFNADTPEVELGLEFDFSRNVASRTYPVRIGPVQRYAQGIGSYVGSELRKGYSASIHLAYSASKKEDLLTDGVRDQGRQTLNPDLIEAKFSLNMIRGPKSDNQKTLFANYFLKISEPKGNFPYRTEFDSNSHAQITQNKPDFEIQGGNLTFFFPDAVIVEFDRSKLIAKDTVEFLFDDEYWMRSYSVDESEEIPDYALSVINAWLSENGFGDVEFDGEYASLDDCRSEIMFAINHTKQTEADGASNPSKLTEDSTNSLDTAILKKRLAIEFEKFHSVEKDLDLQRAKEVASATTHLRDYFRSSVKYLGPLRDNPKPVYQPEALESTADVGYRGEHTAAVLDLNSNARVRYHKPPISDAEDHYEEKSISHGTLHDATVEWLTYLGVAEEVITEDAGVFGNLLKVAPESSGKLHDLTNVGVGVSQVLPIVVMALLAPRGSILIFEQPELHLHPKVQARLADFFLALSWSDKQTILETHSEYLVDRFRLRIATSEKASVKDSINILFSEKVAESTAITPVEISEYGSIENWPVDFFEQSQRDSSRILKSAAAKRRVELDRSKS